MGWTSKHRGLCAYFKGICFNFSKFSFCTSTFAVLLSVSGVFSPGLATAKSASVEVAESEICLLLAVAPDLQHLLPHVPCDGVTFEDGIQFEGLLHELGNRVGLPQTDFAESVQNFAGLQKAFGITVLDELYERAEYPISLGERIRRWGKNWKEERAVARLLVQTALLFGVEDPKHSDGRRVPVTTLAEAFDVLHILTEGTEVQGWVHAYASKWPHQLGDKNGSSNLPLRVHAEMISRACGHETLMLNRDYSLAELEECITDDEIADMLLLAETDFRLSGRYHLAEEILESSYFLGPLITAVRQTPEFRTVLNEKWSTQSSEFWHEAHALAEDSRKDVRKLVHREFQDAGLSENELQDRIDDEIAARRAFFLGSMRETFMRRSTYQFLSRDILPGMGTTSREDMQIARDRMVELYDPNDEIGMTVIEKAQLFREGSIWIANILLTRGLLSGLGTGMAKSALGRSALHAGARASAGSIGRGFAFFSLHGAVAGAGLAVTDSLTRSLLFGDGLAAWNGIGQKMALFSAIGGVSIIGKIFSGGLIRYSSQYLSPQAQASLMRVVGRSGGFAHNPDLVQRAALVLTVPTWDVMFATGLQYASVGAQDRTFLENYARMLAIHLGIKFAMNAVTVVHRTSTHFHTASASGTRTPRGQLMSSPSSSGLPAAPGSPASPMNPFRVATSSNPLATMLVTAKARSLSLIEEAARRAEQAGHRFGSPWTPALATVGSFDSGSGVNAFEPHHLMTAEQPDATSVASGVAGPESGRAEPTLGNNGSAPSQLPVVLDEAQISRLARIEQINRDPAYFAQEIPGLNTVAVRYMKGTPIETADGILLILHGLGSDGSHVGSLAKWFQLFGGKNEGGPAAPGQGKGRNKSNYVTRKVRQLETNMRLHTVGFDLPGCGNGEDLGQVGSVEATQAYMRKAFEWVKSLAPDKPLFVVARSASGALSTLAAESGVGLVQEMAFINPSMPGSQEVATFAANYVRHNETTDPDDTYKAHEPTLSWYEKIFPRITWQSSDDFGGLRPLFLVSREGGEVFDPERAHYEKLADDGLIHLTYVDHPRHDLLTLQKNAETPSGVNERDIAVQAFDSIYRHFQASLNP